MRAEQPVEKRLNGTQRFLAKKKEQQQKAQEQVTALQAQLAAAQAKVKKILVTVTYHEGQLLQLERLLDEEEAAADGYGEEDWLREEEAADDTFANAQIAASLSGIPAAADQPPAAK